MFFLAVCPSGSKIATTGVFYYLLAHLVLLILASTFVFSPFTCPLAFLLALLFLRFSSSPFTFVMMYLSVTVVNEVIIVSWTIIQVCKPHFDGPKFVFFIAR